VLFRSHLPYTGSHPRRHWFSGNDWIEAWVYWDGFWYGDIADRGYWAFAPNQQGPVAFFPTYPLLMRLGKAVVGDARLAGILLTVAAGATAAGLFFTWLRERMSPAAAWTALLLFLLYPFSYYLYGAVYADAVFVASVLGDFLLLDRDQPWLAGLVGAMATAARPVGFVLVIALAVRAMERRGGWRQLSWRDAGVLLSGAGVGAFCMYTWVRFGTPLAFVEAQGGWEQDPGPATWLKFRFFKDVVDVRNPAAWLVFVSHAVVTVGGLALVPAVVKRFGWGYGIYVLLGLGLSALSIKNFFGMSRYALSAFPCFAVAGQLLADWARLRVPVLVASGLTLVGATSFYARGHYLS
jgi:Gpi18-like mannosyltransferase